MRSATTTSAFAVLVGCTFAAVPANAQSFVARLAGEEKFVRGRAFACSGEREATIALVSASGDTSFVVGLASPQLGPDSLPVGREGARVVYMSSKAGLIQPDDGFVVLDSIRDRVVYGTVAMINADSALGVVAFRAEYLGMWPNNDGLGCSPGERMAYIRGRGWPQRYTQAVLEGRVLVGMSPAMVHAVLGTPTRVVRTESAQGVGERWLYGLSDFIEFKNGRVSLIQYSR